MRGKQIGTARGEFQLGSEVGCNWDLASWQWVVQRMRDKRVKMLVYSQNALFQFLSPKLSTRNSPEIAVRTKRFQPKSKPMPALSETVNKVCKSSWMKHTRETANGNKIITGFILMTKNITQHLTNQLSHAVTSF